MSLLSQITNLFRRAEPEVTRTTRVETSPAVPDGLYSQFQATRTRRGRVEAARRMYREDTRVRRLIRDLARDATKGGFEVVIEAGPNVGRAEDVAAALMQRVRMEQRIDDWFRLCLRDGDVFLEAVADERREIVEVSRKPTLEMHRHTDQADRFIDSRRAFWYSSRETSFNSAPPRSAVWWPAWAIVHARWEHDGDDRYGWPLFGAAGRSYKRVSEGETDISVRRKTRAGMRYVHTLEGASEPEIAAYIERNKAALDLKAALADFYTNRKGGIAAVQGDARLGEISDVEHHIETMALASPLPLQLIGYGRNLNRDILEQKLEQYERALESTAGWVISEMVQPLLERQWLLAGIWPDGLTYSIRHAFQKPLRAEDVQKTADALLKLRATGLFGDEMLIEIGASMLPQVDGARAKEELAAAVAARGDEIGRIGANAAGGRR